MLPERPAVHPDLPHRALQLRRLPAPVHDEGDERSGDEGKRADRSCAGESICMPEVILWLSALLLVIVANVAPWAAGRFLSGHWRAPLDGGATLADGTRVLGDHKTWRGLVVGVIACGVAARLLQLPLLLGVAFGTLSLIADVTGSFIKRRLRLQPGAEIPMLDQIPEALVPLLALSRPLGLGFVECVAIALVFMLLDLSVMRLRHPL